MSGYSRQYYLNHREDILRKQKERNAEKKRRISEYLEKRQSGVEVPQAERKELESLISHEYEKYIEKCRKQLEVYSYRGIKRAEAICGDAVCRYFEEYPFESFGEALIKKELGRCAINKNRAEYDECYDAGMLAYLYSMHRCAVIECQYVLFYAKKMIRIYVRCARSLYRDEHNFCAINHLRLVSTDRF